MCISQFINHILLTNVQKLIDIALKSISWLIENNDFTMLQMKCIHIIYANASTQRSESQTIKKKFFFFFFWNKSKKNLIKSIRSTDPFGLKSKCDWPSTFYFLIFFFFFVYYFHSHYHHYEPFDFNWCCFRCDLENNWIRFISV